MKRLDAGGGNFVKRAVDGLHDGRAGASAILVVGDPDGDPGRSDNHRGRGPAVVDAGFRWPRRRQCDDAAFINTAASDALVEMILEQSCAGAGETAGAEIGEERLESCAI